MADARNLGNIMDDAGQVIIECTHLLHLDEITRSKADLIAGTIEFAGDASDFFFNRSSFDDGAVKQIELTMIQEALTI